MVIGASVIFPSTDMERTGNYYENVLGFQQEKYLSAQEPHICLYLDQIEIILTQANRKTVPNHQLYGYGYDAYFYSNSQKELQEKLIAQGAKVVRGLRMTDYQNNEFVIEDIDGRWIAFGLKEKA